MHEREADDDPQHVGSGLKYVAALVALLLLTIVTLGLHFVPLGVAGPVVALAIAGTKVTIVALIFMELRESLAATRMVAITMVAFVALLCFGIVGDVLWR
jgi:caa(3)-type oxidase subunit IV